MIELHDVTKDFNPGRPNHVTAVAGVSLRLEAGAATVLRGPSGSGKTTLLTLVGGLARPSAGRILLDGDLLSDLPEHFLAAERRRAFGFIFQRFNLVEGLSALDNVLLPALPEGLPRRTLRARGRALLDRFHMAHRVDTPVDVLSGGEAQRVAIARALVNRPRVLVADEPTASLDTTLARELLAILADLKAEGHTLIMASHDPLLCDDPLIDRTVAMRDGRLADAGGEAD